MTWVNLYNWQQEHSLLTCSKSTNRWKYLD